MNRWGEQVTIDEKTTRTAPPRPPPQAAPQEQADVAMEEAPHAQPPQYAQYHEQYAPHHGGGHLAQEQLDVCQAILARINYMEMVQAEQYTAVQAGLGSLRTYVGQQFAIHAKELARLRIQPQRQLWHRMYEREQQQIQATQMQDQIDEENAANPLGNVGGANIQVAAPRQGPRPNAVMPRRTVNNIPMCRAELSKGPGTLHELWTEWTHGIGTLKPAKDFTREERGRSKYAYSRRRVFWDMVSLHVLADISSDLTIARIYGAYGRKLPVTEILKRMTKDKKLPGGCHPNLQLTAEQKKQVNRKLGGGNKVPAWARRQA